VSAPSAKIVREIPFVPSKTFEDDATGDVYEIGKWMVIHAVSVSDKTEAPYSYAGAVLKMLVRVNGRRIDDEEILTMDVHLFWHLFNLVTGR
jgi:hypothetical protein